MAMALVLGAMAAVLMAGALLLWQNAASRERRVASAAFIDSQLQAQRTPNVASVSAAPPAPRGNTGLGPFDRLLLRAGVVPDRPFYLLRLAVLLCTTLIGALVGGWLAAGVALFGTLVLMYFRLWWVAERRIKRMVSQLPVFLDAVVRLITIGSSLGSAFQTAAPSVEQPLREVVERVAAQNRSGKDLDHALAQMSRLYDLKELQLVAAVVAVTLRFGGRSDQVLDRLSAFIRDLEQARVELVALSAEVRMSAWILALLPILLACYLVIFNADMFLGMYHDPTGFKMLLLALGLEVTGAYMLYRMAKSI